MIVVEIGGTNVYKEVEIVQPIHIISIYDKNQNLVIRELEKKYFGSF